MQLPARLQLPAQEAMLCGTRYNVPLLNALVFYVGIQVSIGRVVVQVTAAGFVQKNIQRVSYHVTIMIIINKRCPKAVGGQLYGEHGLLIAQKCANMGETTVEYFLS